jgi:hypothetical protein
MSYTLSFLQSAIRCVNSDQDAPELEFPLASTLIIYDDRSEAIEFNCNGRRVSMAIGEISSPVLADYAALKSLISSYRDAALQVGGKMGEPVEVTVQRPADTTAYAVNDVLSSSTSAPAAIILDLATAGVSAGGSGYLVKLRALTNNKNWTARLRIHFYKSAITPGNDNSAFGLLWANRANRIGSVDLPAFNTADTTASDAANSLNADLRFPFKLASGETRLWAIIQILDAGTPASGQQFFFSILVDRN